jgi:hypothetical protein
MSSVVAATGNVHRRHLLSDPNRRESTQEEPDAVAPDFRLTIVETCRGWCCHKGVGQHCAQPSVMPSSFILLQILLQCKLRFVAAAC